MVIPQINTVIHAESEVKNEDETPRTFTFAVRMMDADGREVARFNGETVTMQPGETRTVKAQQQVEGLHFWEVAEPAAGELDLFKAKNGGETKIELRIVELELIEAL